MSLPGPKPKPGGPGRPRGGTSHKRPFEHLIGRTKYVDAQTAFQKSLGIGFSKAALKPLISNPSMVKADNTRVFRNQVNPFEIERRLVGHLKESRRISLVIINETKDRINKDDLERGLRNMPHMMTRIGSVFLSYHTRMAKNWTDNIGHLDIVVAVNKDDRVIIYDSDRPSPPTGHKINVHIPEPLLKLIASGALSFVEALDRDLQEEAKMAYYASRVEEAFNRYRWPNVLNETKRNYNFRLDGAKAGSLMFKNRTEWLGVNSRKINSWNTARSIRKHLKPHVNIDASKLNRHLKWIGANVGKDVEVLRIRASSKALNTAAKELGSLGNLLILGVIIQKRQSDTWTASTVVDTAVLATAIVAAIGGFEAVAMAVVAYNLVDFVTGDSLSGIWDHVFPRNKQFAPPISSFYVDR